jgi:glycosyltransferase involved in cell wall biosynthesis
MPNIIIGLYYKAIWGARVLMDVDDEELAIVGADTPLDLRDWIAANGGRADFHGLAEQDWTRVAVGLAGLFDGLTVSNEALRARYGGLVVPHARSASAFVRAPAERDRGRAELGIGSDEIVFLFLGTPRRHKGVLQTARALAELGRDDLRFLVIGSFEDQLLETELQAIPGLRLTCLPDQPLSRLPALVSLGDATVLLQDCDSEQARQQFPAKLVDALAGGLLAFVSQTPALAPIIEAGAAIAVTPETLTATLARTLSQPETCARQRHAGRAWFERFLSIEACSPALGEIAVPVPEAPPLGHWFNDPRQTDAAALLGLTPPAPAD